MPNLIFHLSGENIGLAVSEIAALTNKDNYMLLDRFLILNTGKKHLEKRLALTHTIYDLLFISTRNNIIKDIEAYDWNRICKKDFSVRAVESDTIKEKDFASMIHKRMKDPKVNLKDPKTRIVFLFTKTKIIAATRNTEIENSFSSRSSHLRPAPHPTSLNPKLARALINITGIKKGQTLLDPFCGSGGILIEAGLMGIRSVGYDMDKMMLKRSKINLDKYKIRHCKLSQKDSTRIKKRFSYIVTDLPYGKNSRLSDKSLESLYLDFLKTTKKILKNKAVIIFPDFINYKRLIEESGLEILQEFNYYLHKSLSKKIVLLKS